jgi:WD40 repeat protein
MERMFYAYRADISTVLTDLITSTTLQTYASAKFVVRAMFSPDGRYFATASYDRHVVIYRMTTSFMPPPVDEDDMPIDDSDDPLVACEPLLRYEEVKRIKVDSNPEAIMWHSQSTWLMYTLRSAHLLYYINVDSWETRTKSFNPHPMDTHVSFSVLDLALHPSGRILACQTGDSRGRSGERVLLYGVEPEEVSRDLDGANWQTERLACIWTGTDSDDFVLPRMAWLPDGSGLMWVEG